MRRLLCVLSFCVLLITPSVASAQLDIGVQGSWGEKFDFALGGRVALALPGSLPLALFGTFDYFFPDNKALSYYEVNGNLAFEIQIPESPLAPYAGVGVSFSQISEDQNIDGDVVRLNDSTLGFNAIGGLKYRVGSWIPYAEARYSFGRDFEKVTVRKGEQFVITAGVMINVGPGLSPVP